MVQVHRWLACLYTMQLAARREERETRAEARREARRPGHPTEAEQLAEAAERKADIIKDEWYTAWIAWHNGFCHWNASVAERGTRRL